LGRRTSGVLIAVPESALARGGAMLAEAVPKVDAFGAFLEQRFPGAAIERVAPAPGRPVTRAAVCDAFAAARPAAGDLFVVLFFGHGVPASDRRRDRCWALTTEELGGADLSHHLGALPAGVDTVVISLWRPWREGSVGLQDRLALIAVEADEDVDHPAVGEVDRVADGVELTVERHRLLAVRALRRDVALNPRGPTAELVPPADVRAGPFEAEGSARRVSLRLRHERDLWNVQAAPPMEDSRLLSMGNAPGGMLRYL
jgi:hypothetical protein